MTANMILLRDHLSSFMTSQSNLTQVKREITRIFEELLHYFLRSIVCKKMKQHCVTLRAFPIITIQFYTELRCKHFTFFIFRDFTRAVVHCNE